MLSGSQSHRHSPTTPSPHFQTGGLLRPVTPLLHVFHCVYAWIGCVGFFPWPCVARWVRTLWSDSAIDTFQRPYLLLIELYAVFLEGDTNPFSSCISKPLWIIWRNYPPFRDTSRERRLRDTLVSKLFAFPTVFHIFSLQVQNILILVLPRIACLSSWSLKRVVCTPGL